MKSTRQCICIITLNKYNIKLYTYGIFLKIINIFFFPIRRQPLEKYSIFYQTHKSKYNYTCTLVTTCFYEVGTFHVSKHCASIQIMKTVDEMNIS